MARWQTDDYRPVEQNDDLPLFSHRHDPPASREAAENAQERAAGQRSQILVHLDYAGHRGCIAEEIDVFFGWTTPSGSPAGKRLSELLRTSPPKVIRLRDTRPTSTGSPSHVHVLPEHLDGRATIEPVSEAKLKRSL